MAAGALLHAAQHAPDGAAALLAAAAEPRQLLAMVAEGGPCSWGIIALAGWIAWALAQGELELPGKEQAPCLPVCSAFLLPLRQAAVPSLLPLCHPHAAAVPWRGMATGPRALAPGAAAARRRHELLRTFCYGAASALLWLSHLDPLEFRVSRGGLFGCVRACSADILASQQSAVLVCWCSGPAAGPAAPTCRRPAPRRPCAPQPLAMSTLFLPSLPSNTNRQSWADVYFFCGERYQNCTPGFRWNARWALRAGVLTCRGGAGGGWALPRCGCWPAGLPRRFRPAPTCCKCLR